MRAPHAVPAVHAGVAAGAVPRYHRAAAPRAVTMTDPLFSRRLPHVLTRADLVLALAATYAGARGVDDDEARERLSRALAVPGALDDLYRGVSAALREAQGPRTTDDALVDRLSARVQARRARVRALEATPPVAAVLVRLDLEIGLAPEPMRATLASERGRAVLDQGLRAVGAHLVKELLKG